MGKKPTQTVSVGRYFVVYRQGRHGGNGTGNDDAFVTDICPRKNQSGELPEKLPCWLGTTNGISVRVVSSHTSYAAAARAAREYLRS